MKFEFIRAEKARYPVRTLCAVLEVSRSGFYAWMRRPPSARAKERDKLLQEVRRVHVRHRGRYGSPRIFRELRKGGLQPGRHRIARLMRENGIVARPKKRFVTTTQSDHGLAKAENVLNRQFKVRGLNEVWAADITYIDTDEGWLYLAVVLDLGSRSVVGWATSKSLDAEVALRALRQALANRRPPRLHHSDAGTQYVCGAYQALLAENGIISSISRPGNCWDNAPVESFFSTLKTEVPELTRSASRRRARASLFEYIETYYNRERMHSTLDYMTPAEYEAAA